MDKLNFSITKNGKELDKTLYEWDEKTRTFSTLENGLVLDFGTGFNCTFDTGFDCTFKTGSGCTFDTSYNCTFDTGFDCTFKTGFGCTFKTSSECTFNTRSYCTFKTGSGCTFKTGSYCTFKTGFGCTFDTGSDCIFNTSYNCTFDTGYNCTFKTSYDCTFDTGSDCIFNTSYNCTFKTGSNCTFDTGSDCIFNTSYNCTFKTSYNCTFDTGSDCVIVRRDTYQIIEISDESITLCPHAVRGYIKNGVYSETGKPSIIADGILSEIISKKERKGITIYKVINYKETKQTYLIESDGTFSHGRTIKEAKESFKYKISNRDTSQYDSLTIDSILTIEESIKLYRTITGACEYGTRCFVENLSNPPKKLTIKKLIKITEGQFNYSMLVEYFNNKQQQT